MFKNIFKKNKRKSPEKLGTYEKDNQSKEKTLEKLRGRINTIIEIYQQNWDDRFKYKGETESIGDKIKNLLLEINNFGITAVESTEDIMQLVAKDLEDQGFGNLAAIVRLESQAPQLLEKIINRAEEEGVGANKILEILDMATRLGIPPYDIIGDINIDNPEKNIKIMLRKKLEDIVIEKFNVKNLNEIDFGKL